MASKKVASKWTSMLMLTLGLGVFWGFGIAAIGMVGMAFKHNPAATYEEIQVTSDGTPFIHARIGGSYSNIQLRMLDGTEIDQEVERTLDLAPVRKPYQEPRFFTSSLHWGETFGGR